jgi:hypothetical protein
MHDFVGIDTNHDVIDGPVHLAKPVRHARGDDNDIARADLAAFAVLD